MQSRASNRWEVNAPGTKIIIRFVESTITLPGVKALQSAKLYDQSAQKKT